MRTERLITSGQWFTLIDGSTFETLAGQFQTLTDKVICVKDGTDLHLFGGGDDVPPYLKYESECPQASTGVTEYCFRSVDDDSLYTFFSLEVSRWLRQGRQGELRVPLLRSSVTDGSSHQVGRATASLRHPQQRAIRPVLDPQLSLPLPHKGEMRSQDSLPYRVVTVPPSAAVANIQTDESASDGLNDVEVDDVSGSQFSVEVPDSYRVQDCVTYYRRTNQ